MTPEERDAALARITAAILAQFDRAAALASGAVRVRETAHVAVTERGDDLESVDNLSTGADLPGDGARADGRDGPDRGGE